MIQNSTKPNVKKKTQTFTHIPFYRIFKNNLVPKMNDLAKKVVTEFPWDHIPQAKEGKKKKKSLHHRICDDQKRQRIGITKIKGIFISKWKNKLQALNHQITPWENISDSVHQSRESESYLKFAKRLQSIHDLSHGSWENLQRTIKSMSEKKTTSSVSDLLEGEWGFKQNQARNHLFIRAKTRAHERERKPRGCISPSFPWRRLQSLSSYQHQLLLPSPFLTRDHLYAPPILPFRSTIRSIISERKHKQRRNRFGFCTIPGTWTRLR